MQNAVRAILEECQPFLALLRQGDGLLLRGAGPSAAPHYRGQVRRDRRPRNMPPALHEAADWWFSQRFGVRYRGAALFCTGGRTRAGRFGAVCAVFPVEAFQFCWSPLVDDLFDWSRREGLVAGPPEGQAEARCGPGEFVGRLERLDYRDAGLAEAIRSGQEIMLACATYHAVAVDGAEAEGELRSALGLQAGA